MSARPAKVRSARLTDLAALGELSRLSHGTEDRDARVRSLGLPVSASQISVFGLFRLPLGAFQPHDKLYVYEDEHRLAGLIRVERDSHRDEWTIVELDAVDHGDAGDIRFRLVQHLLRDGSKRGAARFHVACADVGGNVELFMQAGFARYGEERILHRSPTHALPALPSDVVAGELAIRPAVPRDALGLQRLYQLATPPPVSRLEAYRLPDWERQGAGWRVPRSALTPILRFADVEAYVQECPGRAPRDLAAFVQVGLAKEDQPHYLRVISRPDHDASALIDYGLGIIAERTGAPTVRGGRWRGHRPPGATPEAHDGYRPGQGVVSPVRTYESPLDRRLEEAGFRSMADVTLLMKETLIRVAEPALVPAVR
jgi:hypothetical protein